MSTDLIPKEIQSFEYYVNKCPLYLQNSEGFIEHFRIWYDFLIHTVPSAEKFISLMDIFDPNYLNIINSLEGEGSDLLDKIGKIFNVRRNLTVTYEENNQTYEKNISLDTKDFLTFVRAQIIKSYSNGSYIQMREFYDKSQLLIYYSQASNPSATINIYLLEVGDSSISYSENIQDLFKAGLLTIESMGINYKYSIQNYNKILIWDKPVSGEYTGWDYGEWVI